MAVASLLPGMLVKLLRARVVLLVDEDGEVCVCLVNVVARADFVSEEDHLWQRDHSARSYLPTAAIPSR